MVRYFQQNGGIVAIMTMPPFFIKMFEKNTPVEAIFVVESCIFRIMEEFVASIEVFANLTKTVSIFASAKTKPEDGYYQKEDAIAQGLAEKGFAVITVRWAGVLKQPLLARVALPTALSFTLAI